MEIANASLLDESTSASEAMTLLHAVRDRQQKKNNVIKFFVDENVLPQTLAVLETRSEPLNIELVVGDPGDFDFSEEFFGVLLQYPGKNGLIRDFEAFTQEAIQNNIKVAVSRYISEPCKA